MNLAIVKNYFVDIRFLFYQPNLTLFCCFLDNHFIKNIKDQRQKIVLKNVY